MFPKLLLVRVYYQSNRLETVSVMRERDPRASRGWQTKLPELPAVSKSRESSHDNGEFGVL